MGMGEPFSNPINVFESLEVFTNPNKIGMGQRKISISTVGIIPGIEKLTQTYPQINLAFSLHSPFPDQRLQLMPITKAYSIDQVFTCLDERMKLNNHKIFIAYVLLAGINDSVEHARALAQLITANQHRQRLLHVNLIRYNPGNSKTVYQRPNKVTINTFKDILTKSGVKNTLRQDFGVNIDAACGQLAAASRS
jgi:23S rRNA (adenine-C8)-methyltransferase